MDLPPWAWPCACPGGRNQVAVLEMRLAPNPTAPATARLEIADRWGVIGETGAHVWFELDRPGGRAGAPESGRLAIYIA
jgi:hypothetical protein